MNDLIENSFIIEDVDVHGIDMQRQELSTGFFEPEHGSGCCCSAASMDVEEAE